VILFGSLARGEARWDSDADVRYQGGDPFVREALDHGEVLHG
jgi:predicted nucleotidyltransferase